MCCNYQFLYVKGSDPFLSVMLFYWLNASAMAIAITLCILKSIFLLENWRHTIIEVLSWCLKHAKSILINSSRCWKGKPMVWKWKKTWSTKISVYTVNLANVLKIFVNYPKLLLHNKAGFTQHDTLPSLLDRMRICQCKRSGARARPRVFLSCASFSSTSTAQVVSDYRLSKPIGVLLFSAHIYRRKLFHFLTTSSQ